MKRYIKCSNDNLVYENYGDVNFLDTGLLLAKDPSNPRCFYFIECDPVLPWEGDIGKYYIMTGYIDIDDSWIDEDAVNKFADITRDNPEWFAEALLRYYGASEFGADYPYDTMTAEEVENFVRQFNIPSNIYFDGE